MVLYIHTDIELFDLKRKPRLANVTFVQYHPLKTLTHTYQV